MTDRILQRIVLFSLSGEHYQTRRVVSSPLPATNRPAIPLALAPNGLVLGESRVDMTSIARGLLTSIPIVAMTRDGEIVRQVAERSVSGLTKFAAFGNRVAVFLQPLAELAFRAVAENGSWLVIVDARPECAV